MLGAADGADVGRCKLAHASASPRVRVSRVRSRLDRRDFVDLPRKVYAHDRGWIAKPASSVRQEMDPRRNPFLREAFAEHFIARDAQGRCVGRIAAIIHPAHIRRHGCKAFFGQFECVDDPRVAARLMASVENWAGERGIRVIQGPCTYAMTQEAGLQVSGFEHPAVVLQNYNPPYYADLLRAAGYEPAFLMSTFAVARQSDLVGRAMRRGDEVAQRLGLVTRSLDMRRFDHELERIRLCYNRAFVTHPETAAISRDVFAGQARELRAIVDPGLVRIIEKDAKTAAFAVAVPNVAEVLARARGKLSLGMMLRFKQLLRRVRSVVVVMVGADPLAADERGAGTATGYGIGSALAAQVAYGLCENDYELAHTTWIHDGNWRAQALMRAIGARPLKRYAIMQKECR